MNGINQYIGDKVRNYRKMKKMTLQQLADAIHKSRATVCKYETGEIAMDVQTLYEIGQVLDVSLSQLTDYYESTRETEEINPEYEGESPFFKAETLFFYFFDGRYHHLKEGVIQIHKHTRREDGSFDAVMSIRHTTPNGRSCQIYYNGSVLYSDMLIRFSFLNQYNKLEQDLLYIFNPLELRDFTEGLLCGISSADLRPCAFKCLVTLAPSQDHEQLRKRLMLTARDLRRWQKMNMFIVANDG